ncbi:MAG: hypothetical protein A3F16_00075 [Deltaproteobacteria bacterium RIFCSPHIGHO2_12_FULL_43_9]|nr:MAG: hypothetical protein A3F16_00075 [Deltaproteobacteria bacterium RIFCSPHIGHO2_12_FULL_43_9]
MWLIATGAVKEKIKFIHSVDFIEAEEAFFNFKGPMLIDDREKHKSKPHTVWFISETFEGRLLKLVIIPYIEEGLAVLRTAYEPSKEEKELYESTTQKKV